MSIFDPDYNDFQQYKRWKSTQWPGMPAVDGDWTHQIAMFILYLMFVVAWLAFQLLVFLVVFSFKFISAASQDKTAVAVGRQKTALGAGFKVRLPNKMRDKHVHVLGPIGAGKTTLLLNMAVHDMQRGSGIVAIDPKGGFISSLLHHIPRNRLADVILLDATDKEFPVAFNIMDTSGTANVELAGDNFVNAFKKMSKDNWGPRLDRVLRYTIAALLAAPNSTIYDIQELLFNEDFRQRILRHNSNFQVTQFFETQFPQLTRGANLNQVVQPILNRIDQVLMYPTIANMLIQTPNRFNFTDVVNQGKILLINIPAGEIGLGLSSFFGALVVAQLQMAAMSGLGPVARRPPMYFYLDEFHHFHTSAFDTIVTEARQFKLGLVMANQYNRQLGTSLREAIDHVVAARVVAYADERSRHFVIYHRVQNQPQDEAMILHALPPLGSGNPAMVNQIRAHTRQTYATPVAQVEDIFRQRAAQARAAAHPTPPHGTPRPTPEDLAEAQPPTQPPTNGGGDVRDLLARPPDDSLLDDQPDEDEDGEQET
ncbi:MAG: type IV secretion system DNA-binding domain-containing protein [Chloroflexi bacterium]|nr:type IV secretion system DNA-binding domain-containing protein [Chloroflexota bacterium]